MRGREGQPCQPREPNAGKSGNISRRFPIEIYSSFSRSSFIFATAVNGGSDGGTAITHLIETNAIVTDEKKGKGKKETSDKMFNNVSF